MELLEKEIKTLKQQLDRHRSYTNSEKENEIVLDNKKAELTSNLATSQQDNERVEENFLKVNNEIKDNTYKLEADFTSMIKEMTRFKKVQNQPYIPIPSPELGSLKVPEMEKKIPSQSWGSEKDFSWNIDTNISQKKTSANQPADAILVMDSNGRFVKPELLKKSISAFKHYCPT